MSTQLRHSLLLLLTALIWGVAFVAQSVGMDYVGPFTFTASRSLIGAVVLLPVIWFRTRKETAVGTEQKRLEVDKHKKRTLLVGGIVCGVFLCIATNLQQIGLQYSTVGKSGFVTAMYIVLVPILGIFLHKGIDIRKVISVILAVCGLYLLCMTGGNFSIGKGDIFTILCALAFSLQILSVDHFAPKVDCVKLASLQFLVCGICSCVPMLLFEHPHFAQLAAAWMPILYAGILSNGVAYTLQIVAQKGLNPTVASLIMSLESVISVLAGWAILHQTLTKRELAGCVFMFAAIIIVQLKPEENGGYHEEYN
jgi:drug/metabolite transporter (DMT)-like permease